MALNAHAQSAFRLESQLMQHEGDISVYTADTAAYSRTAVTNIYGSVETQLKDSSSLHNKN